MFSRAFSLYILSFRIDLWSERRKGLLEERKSMPWLPNWLFWSSIQIKRNSGKPPFTLDRNLCVPTVVSSVLAIFSSNSYSCACRVNGTPERSTFRNGTVAFPCQRGPWPLQTSLCSIEPGCPFIPNNMGDFASRYTVPADFYQRKKA